MTPSRYDWRWCCVRSGIAEMTKAATAKRRSRDICRLPQGRYVMSARVDVLIPTYSRPAALAVTLACLFSQTLADLRVVVSDQTEDFDVDNVPEVCAVARAIESRG